MATQAWTMPPGLHCAYNLTGNVSGVCPECGTPVSGEGASSGPDRD